MKKKSVNRNRVKMPYYLGLIVVVQVVFIPMAIANSIHIKGFLTASGGVLSNDTAKIKAYSKDFDFRPDSILGLQITANINENYRITSQLVASGNEDSSVRMDWGYLSNDITDDLTLRFGRLRGPLYSYSESLEVGYAYPWISPPAEVYDLIPIRSFDGVQAYFKKPLGEWEVSILSYLGSASQKTTIASSDSVIRLANYGGFGMVWDRDWLTFQVGYHQAKTTFTSAEIGTLIAGLNTSFPDVAADFSLNGKKVRFYHVGVQLNWQQFMFISEATQMEVERSFIPSNKSWYTLFGYYLSPDILLHLTYAEVVADLQNDFADSIPAGVDSQLDALRDGINTILRAVDSKQYSTLLGVRYDHVPGVAYKFEWQRVRVFAGRDSVYGKSDISNDGHTDVLSVAVDVVF